MNSKEITFHDLGNYRKTARLTVHRSKNPYPGNASLIFYEASFGEESVFYPAQSMEFNGLDAIKKVRDVCQKAIDDAAIELTEDFK